MTATWYEAQRNTDMTEGKGFMESFAAFANLEDALQAVKGQGVMGYGDGEVVEVTVNPLESFEAFKQGLTKADYYSTVGRTETRIYGYRKDLTGKWGTGFIDNRDAPTHDPEFNEYLRLKGKFEKEA